MLKSIEMRMAMKLPSVAAAPFNAHIHGRLRPCDRAFNHRIPTGKQNPSRKPHGETRARQIRTLCHSKSAVNACITGTTAREYATTEKAATSAGTRLCQLAFSCHLSEARLPAPAERIRPPSTTTIE